ncbi:MAG: sugar O-acetyltransferase [Muribaculaceae bacterium]|nr:sugar O-acetyltransferase [Muribaculaceae bacterium]
MSENDFLAFTANGGVVEAGSPMHNMMHKLSQRALRLTAEINNKYHNPEELRELMSELTGTTLDENFALFTPFYTDCGLNIKIGKGTFINMGCSFQDWGGISIGNNCLIGHNCTICTVNHSEDPDNRGDMKFAGVEIGDKVWIGANVTILPGVSIGDGCIIGAGAVVSKSIPTGHMAIGVPAKIIRKI